MIVTIWRSNIRIWSCLPSSYYSRHSFFTANFCRQKQCFTVNSIMLYIYIFQCCIISLILLKPKYTSWSLPCKHSVIGRIGSRSTLASKKDTTCSKLVNVWLNPLAELRPSSNCYHWDKCHHPHMDSTFFPTSSQDMGTAQELW